MPPAVSRMLTPVIVFEIAKSAWVTCRAQPPFWTRFGALLNEAQSIGISPTSVAGGNCAEGNCLPMASLCGPGSLRFPGVLALTAPCGGWSGLPNEAPRAAFAVTIAPAAETASISRLENILPLLSKNEALASRFVQFRGVPLVFKSDADVRVGTRISTTP